MSPKAKASNSRCSIYKTKDRAGWKLGKDKFLSHLQPHGDIQSEDIFMGARSGQNYIN